MRNITLKHNPRDYQIRCRDAAVSLIKSNPEQWHLFKSPTGTGKSVMELMIKAEFPDSILITPRVEIIVGLLDKLNHYVDDLSVDKLIALAWEYGITTPIRFRNMLAKGELSFRPSLLIIDEGHHVTADTYQDIRMYLNGVPVVLLTATPYRGTAKGTQEFLRLCGDTVNEVLSLRQAIEYGYCALPEPRTIPLIDDDTIDVSGGEFRVNTVEATETVTSSFDLLKDVIGRYYDTNLRFYDMPTMVAVSSTELCLQLTEILNDNGLPARCVTQATSSTDRRKIFELCELGKLVLVQIDVVSEGVDLKIRRLIDCKPTMSPTRWVQQIGRIMRPWKEGKPEYVCCCRNLERHGYLMEGMLPVEKIKEAQEAFTDEEGKPKFSIRSMGARANDLQGMGKFKVIPVRLHNGITVFCYNLVHVDGFTRTEYFVMVHPNEQETIKGKRVSVRKAEQSGDKVQYEWGYWRRIDTLPELKGCTTATAFPLTDKQRARWESDAADRGLDPYQTVTNQNFGVLHFLKNLGLRIK